MVLLTSTTPAAATASAFPSSAEEGSCAAQSFFWYKAGRGKLHRMMRAFKIVVSCLLAAFSLNGQSPKRPIALDDLARMRAVGDPQVSPDGKWVAYTVGTVDAEKDKRDTDIWMVSWDGAEQIRLTSTADSSESSPHWSPDNKYLAFLTTRGDESQKKQGAQVWLLNRSGGEAQELTNVKGGVSEFEWSPDSKRLVLVARDSNPDDEPEKKDGWKRKTTPPIVIDRYHFKQDREGYLRALHSHLWLFEMDTRKAEPLTTGEFNEQSPAWSPDGRFIAFVSNRTTDPDRNNNSNIYVIEAKSAAQPRQLTSYAGSDGGQPSWSPDGKWIAYLQGDETKYSAYSMNKLAIVPAAEEGQPRILTASLDRPVSGNIVWSSDNQQLMFVVADDRISYIGKIPAGGGRVEKLTTGLRVVSNISRRNNGAMVLLSTTTAEPDEVYALENGAMRRLTHQSDELFRDLHRGTTENS